MSTTATTAAALAPTMTYQNALAKAGLACKELANMEPIVRLDAESARGLASLLEKMYRKFGKEYVDQIFGNMEALLGREALEKAAPSYVWTQPSLSAKLLQDVLEENVVSELKRILSPEVAQGYASNTNAVEIAGLVTTEIDPTVKEIYTKMKSEFCAAQNDDVIEAIDERIKKRFDAGSPLTLILGLKKRADAYDNRRTLGKEPVADSEQVRKALKELRGIPELGHFITYLTTESLRPGGADPKTLLALADEFEQYANKDPRVKEQLAAASRGRGYHAAIASAGQSASQSAGRSVSSSPGRRESKAGSSSPGQREAAGSIPSPREIKESIRKLRKQLMDKASERKVEFCPVCLVDNHALGRCFVAEKARKEVAEDDSKKDGTTGRGAGDRGGRGRRNGP